MKNDSSLYIKLCKKKKEGCDDVIYRQTAMTSLSLRWPFMYYC